jgi:hypothetical protein
MALSRPVPKQRAPASVGRSMRLRSGFFPLHNSSCASYEPLPAFPWARGRVRQSGCWRLSLAALERDLNRGARKVAAAVVDRVILNRGYGKERSRDLVIQLRTRRAQVVVQIRGRRIAVFVSPRVDRKGGPTPFSGFPSATVKIPAAHCTRVPKSGTAKVRQS